MHLREEIFHFCKTESAVLSGKPTIIEAIRHSDLFDSLSKLRVVRLRGLYWLKAVFGLEMGEGATHNHFLCGLR